MKMYTTICIAALFGAAHVPLAAQTETGAYIARIGRDTLAMETFVRTPQLLTGRSLLRQKNLVMREYRAEFNADGSVKHYQVRTYPMKAPQPLGVTFTDANGNSYTPAAVSVSGTPLDTTPGTFQSFDYHGDSVTVGITQGKNPPRISVMSSAGNALPFSENMFAAWQETVRRAFRSKTNEVALLEGRQPLRFTVTRPAAGKMVLNDAPDAFGPMIVKTDAKGRMVQLDMRASTDKYLVDLLPALNLDALAASFAPRPLGVLSPRDTAHFGGGADVVIDYSRPSARGRTVFGGIQPWGVVWRTGADAATQLITKRDLDIAGVAVPAGTYTLWVIPAQSGEWTFIINKQHGQWGTDYDQKQDLARIPVRVAPSRSFIETLRIALVPNGDGGAISITWENSELLVPFKLK